MFYELFDNSNSVIGSKIVYFRAKYRIGDILRYISVILLLLLVVLVLLLLLLILPHQHVLRFMSNIVVTVPTEDQQVSILLHFVFPLVCKIRPLIHNKYYKDLTLLKMLK